ncbi:unnamed protein product [Mycena citricolor]|uniref:Protein kinase domain-containing protein n=1 Tax=Mycena citricolor TaxID=2018698 RepID=A0AAD2Q3Q4_9AGAR|nr:unnamed protein product [Mycena citricolor]
MMCFPASFMLPDLRSTNSFDVTSSSYTGASTWRFLLVWSVTQVSSYLTLHCSLHSAPEMSTTLVDPATAASAQSSIAEEEPSNLDATKAVDAKHPASEEKSKRQLCKSKSRRAPNGQVWAHRQQDIFNLYRKLWSISMLEVADSEYPSEKPFSSTVIHSSWKPHSEPEPEPRKLRMWPVITLDGDVENMPDDLIKDPTVPEEIPKPDNDRTPKLTQRIPFAMLPEVLRVKDCNDRLGSGLEKRETTTLEYQRVYPKSDKSIDPKAPRTQADLDLRADYDLIGIGHRATVSRADITLEAPFGLVDRSGPPRLRVIAKISNDETADRAMLKHEARVYTDFPEYLSEDWSGFIGIDTMGSEGGKCSRVVPAGAVVPKFYGYYVPVPSDGADDKQVGRPFILLEYCGKPIQPSKFNEDERGICISFAHRLHDEHDLIQGSYYARNLLVQPGPLTHPPHMRSLETPSFRLIDFGRAEFKAGHDEDEEAWAKTYRVERQMVLNAVLGELQTWRWGDIKIFESRLEEWPRYYTQRAYCIPESFWDHDAAQRARPGDEKRMWDELLSWNIRF